MCRKGNLATSLYARGARGGAYAPQASGQGVTFSALMLSREWYESDVKTNGARRPEAGKEIQATKRSFKTQGLGKDILHK